MKLTPGTGPWPEDDPDANVKPDARFTRTSTLCPQIETLAAALGLPEGAIVRCVFAKWASAGSGGLLELGPSIVDRL